MQSKRLPGVQRTAVGFTGGETPNPTYDSVCDDDGHTEALRIEYDEALTSYDELLDFFWIQYKGSSSSPQYKAAIWFHDDEQRVAALHSAAVHNVVAVEAPQGGQLSSPRSVRRGRGRPRMVHVQEAGPWYDAEEEHQKYLAKSRQRKSSP